MVAKNTEENFWGQVLVGDIDSCWEWKGKAETKEYAETRWNGKFCACHRKAYELFYKVEIPIGLQVCHTCDNPPCCNPHHLFLGTFQDNVDDRERKGRNKMPHSIGEEHGQHKLTAEQVLNVRGLYAKGGHTYYTLADRFHVSFSNIRKIIKRQTWSWLE